MQLVKIYVHFIWCTKNKISFLLKKKIRKTIWNHLEKTFNKNGVYIDFIPGYSDHNHCLIRLPQEESLEKKMKDIKGDQLLWINKNGGGNGSILEEMMPFSEKAIANKIEYKDDYFTIAIMESKIEKAENKKQQDGKKDVQKNGYNEFRIQYGFEKYEVK